MYRPVNIKKKFKFIYTAKVFFSSEHYQYVLYAVWFFLEFYGLQKEKNLLGPKPNIKINLFSTYIQLYRSYI